MLAEYVHEGSIDVNTAQNDSTLPTHGHAHTAAKNTLVHSNRHCTHTYIRSKLGVRDAPVSPKTEDNP